MSINDDLLANIDIVDIVGKYVQLKKAGRNFSGLCPFHNEKTPSFLVSPDKQIFKCFGCGIGGNVIKFVMEYEKIDYWDCVKVLAKDANIDLSSYKFDSAKVEKNANEKEKLKRINKIAYNFFKDAMKKSNIAKKYLRGDRNLSDDIISKFGLGYAPDSHYDLINTLKNKKFDSDDIIKAGLAKKGSSGDLYSFFRNRIMFPIFDNLGNPIAFSGRIINPDDKPKYLNTPETILYDKSKTLYGLNIAKAYIKEFEKLVILEGNTDVIGLSRAGVNIGVASCGTSMTAWHVKIMKRFTENIILAFDNDDAGFEATVRSLKLAYQNDIYPQNIILPNTVKDFDEYVNLLEKEDKLEQLKKFFQDEKVELDLKIVDTFDYILKKYKEKYNFNTPVDRKIVINNLFDILGNIQNYSVVMLYIEKLANLFGLNNERLFEQLKSYSKKNQRFRKNNETKENKKYNNSDTKYVLGSLFYDNFLKVNKLNTEKIVEYIDFISSLCQYFPDSLLQNILINKLNDDEIIKIKEEQLVWEHDFEKSTKEKKEINLINFLKRQIKGFDSIVIKASNIDDNTKQEIIKKRNILLKK